MSFVDTKAMDILYYLSECNVREQMAREGDGELFWDEMQVWGWPGGQER